MVSHRLEIFIGSWLFLWNRPQDVTQCKLRLCICNSGRCLHHSRAYITQHNSFTHSLTSAYLLDFVTASPCLTPLFAIVTDSGCLLCTLRHALPERQQRSNLVNSTLHGRSCWSIYNMSWQHREETTAESSLCVSAAVTVLLISSPQSFSLLSYFVC